MFGAFGPDKDDGRYHQIRCTLKKILRKSQYDELPLYMAMSDRIVAAFKAKGFTFSGDVSEEEEAFQCLRDRDFCAREGTRVNLNRFQGGTAAAKHKIYDWDIDLFERTMRHSRFLYRASSTSSSTAIYAVKRSSPCSRIDCQRRRMASCSWSSESSP